MVRALGLCSGGLDSILSALLLRSNGIQVYWVSFYTPFFSSEKAELAAKENNIPLYVVDITKEYIAMMKKPDCKFGKNMNPCTNCHALMFRLGGKIMVRKGFNFMFSGEVLGQRPMSQNRSSLRYVEKKSGYDGYILRPLSAKKLPETIPEKRKEINREFLLDISGRSRRRQIAIAAKFGVKFYPAPAGGCLLTDENYCRRLVDLFEHQSTYSENHLHLLKFGRHMRLDKQTKIIIGRNHLDNVNIESYVDWQNDFLIKLCEIPGPLVILPNGGSNTVVFIAASICVGYSKAKANTLAKVSIECGGIKNQISILGMSPYESKQFLI